MALVNCGECSSSVSDQASACPKCGNPMKKRGKHVVTTQKTGKDAKTLKLLSTVLIIGSFFMIFAHTVPGHTNLAGIGLLIGVVMRIVAATMKWWKYD